MDDNWPPPWNAIAKSLKKGVGEFQDQLERQAEAGMLSERQGKRMDKALILLKCGFKMAKKALKPPAHIKRPTHDLSPGSAGGTAHRTPEDMPETERGDG